MRAIASLALAAGIVLCCYGCVTAPRSIDVRVGQDRPAPLDSSRVPHPATLEEAQAELDKAYQNIQYLERENARLNDKAENYKRERDESRRKLEKYEED